MTECFIYAWQNRRTGRRWLGACWDARWTDLFEDPIPGHRPLYLIRVRLKVPA